MRQTLRKAERLSGRSAVTRLVQQGKRTGCGCIRACVCANDEERNRILVSVPKRSFKRAVKRNLLKRRIREAYRRHKDLLAPGHDVMLVYTPREVLPYSEIEEAVAQLLEKL